MLDFARSEQRDFLTLLGQLASRRQEQRLQKPSLALGILHQPAEVLLSFAFGCLALAWNRAPVCAGMEKSSCRCRPSLRLPRGGVHLLDSGSAHALQRPLERVAPRAPRSGRFAAPRGRRRRSCRYRSATAPRFACPKFAAGRLVFENQHVRAIHKARSCRSFQPNGSFWVTLGGARSRRDP